MNNIYGLTTEQLKQISGVDLCITETEVDLYYNMALSMYCEIEKNNKEDKTTVMILPVGPVFQYRRFLTLLNYRPITLKNLHIFFMDEYLQNDTEELIPIDSPLSFRGFIERELKQPLKGKYEFNPRQIYFPHPTKGYLYDEKINMLGGVDLCHAGVGIVGHLAFNEPIKSEFISLIDFMSLHTRIVELTPETITINSNTAMRGAFEEIPKRAVTIGMSAILGARRLEIYMNRHWQAAVLRKTLMLEPTSEFPASCVKTHENLLITVTPNVAEVPDPALG